MRYIHFLFKHFSELFLIAITHVLSVSKGSEVAGTAKNEQNGGIPCEFDGYPIRYDNTTESYLIFFERMNQSKNRTQPDNPDSVVLTYFLLKSTGYLVGGSGMSCVVYLLMNPTDQAKTGVDKKTVIISSFHTPGRD